MPRKTDLPEKIKRLRAFVIREKRMPGYNEMLELFEYRRQLRLAELGRSAGATDGGEDPVPSHRYSSCSAVFVSGLRSTRTSPRRWVRPVVSR